MRAHTMTKGFTLIELLVVISIIGVLVTLGVGGTAMIMNQAKVTKAKSTLQMIEMALTQYKNDFGVYPDDEPPVNVFNVLTGYRNDPKEPDASITQRPDWHGPYIKAEAKNFKNYQMNQELVDPWMQPFRLRVQKPEHNKFGIDLWSTGPNMKDEDGKGDDIKNW
jgi:general secretion pathway protein G